MIDPVFQREYAYWRIIFRDIQQSDLGERMALQLRAILYSATKRETIPETIRETIIADRKEKT
jgi:hypothetical protein